MKKIIIAIAAVASTVAVHAASVNWVATNVYAGNTTDKASGIAYFMTTDMAETSAFVAGADFASLTAGAYSYTPTTAGTYSVAASSAVANATLGLDDGVSYSAYLVIFDGATIADSTSFYVTNTKDFTTYTGTSNIQVSFGTQKTASQAAWTSTAVPEPTSGLLLLLGMAGLALKRKHA